MVTYIFTMGREYWGFLSDGHLFDAEGNYRGWLEKKRVFTPDGRFLGRLRRGHFIVARRNEPKKPQRSRQPQPPTPPIPVPPAVAPTTGLLHERFHDSLAKQPKEEQTNPTARESESENEAESRAMLGTAVEQSRTPHTQIVPYISSAKGYKALSDMSDMCEFLSVPIITVIDVPAHHAIRSFY